eukprot:6173661-Pleurochrysis_carterae.AAC.3
MQLAGAATTVARKMSVSSKLTELELTCTTTGQLLYHSCLHRQGLWLRALSVDSNERLVGDNLKT